MDQSGGTAERKHPIARRGVQPNRILAAMDQNSLLGLMPHLQRTTLTAGDVLYDSGEQISHAYFPLNSVICLLAVLSDGGSAQVYAVGREGVTAFTSSRGSKRAFGRYVVQIGGEALRIKLSDLERIRESHLPVRELLRKHVEAVGIQTFQTVACNACHPVDARCCRAILATSDRITRDELPLTHDFLAGMLGVQRSSVSISLKALSLAGCISQHRGAIQILDRKKLLSGSCECYQTVRRHYERLLPLTYSD